MYITSAHNLAALDPKTRAMRWPGPRILLTGPEPAEDTTQLQVALRYYLVVDLAETPSSRFNALRLAITRLARARVAMHGPLLFADDAVPDQEVDRLAEALRDDPWLVEFATDPVQDSLSMLVLGEKIVANPLFTTFFTNLAARTTEAQTGYLINEIENHLAWRKNNKTA